MDDDQPDPLAGLPKSARWYLGLAREARASLDRWRNVGWILRQLRDEGVPWKVITAETGISRATGSRMLVRSRRASGTTDSSGSTGSP